MKPTRWLLGISVLANALMLALYLGVDKHASDRALPVATAASATPPRMGDPNLPALAPAEMKTALLQAGLPEEVVQAVIRGKIWSRHDQRRAELMRKAASSKPWWEYAGAADRRYGLFSAEERSELRHLEAEARAQTLAVLGTSAMDPFGVIAAKFQFLGAEKAVRLDNIMQDYSALLQELNTESGGLLTPENGQRRAAMLEEQQKDLAALLTPEELETFTLRLSPVARSLRPSVIAFEPSDEEYRLIFDAHQKLEKRFPSALTPAGLTVGRSLSDAPDLVEALRAKLGDTRYGDWSTAGQKHTQLLAARASDLGLDSSAVRDLSSLLTRSAAESWRIASDGSIDAAKKRAALTALAADLRQGVKTRMGQEQASTFLADVPWVGRLSSGVGVQLQGDSITYRDVATNVERRSMPRMPASGASPVQTKKGP